MIETDLARIADALEGINSKLTALERFAEDVRWNRDRLAAMDAAKGTAPAPETKPEPETEEKPSMSYDELKAALIAKGVEVPKGTKMTTLQKLWDKANAEPEPVVEQEEAQPEPEVVEAPVEDDGEAEWQQIQEEKKVDEYNVPPVAMTMEEVRETILKHYDPKNEDDVAYMKAALGIFNVKIFADLPEENYADFVKEYLASKGVTNG